MIETFAALFAAHVTADYLLQTKPMVDRKADPRILLRHVADVFWVSALALGAQVFAWQTWLALGLLVALHWGMDWIKTHKLPAGKLWPYLADQAFHIATLALIAALFPTLFADGIWAALAPWLVPWLMTAFLIWGFGVFAVQAGGFAIQLLLAPLPSEDPMRNSPATNAPDASRPPTAALNPTAGMRIGQLERGLVMLLMLIGQPNGIAFLIAAKSILRFGSVKDDRAASEYVIIGTLASVAWALLCAAILIMLLPDSALETWRGIP